MWERGKYSDNGDHTMVYYDITMRQLNSCTIHNSYQPSMLSLYETSKQFKLSLCVQLTAIVPSQVIIGKGA